jgi:hypothetical protein
MIKPPIPTFASVRTRRRVETLRAWAAAGVGVGVLVGVGEGVGVGLAPPAGITVVTAVDVLLDGLGSSGYITSAVLLSIPVAVGLTTKITVALPPPGIDSSRHPIMVVPLQVPWLGVTETKSTPGGRMSLMSSLSEAPGEWFVTVIV